MRDLGLPFEDEHVRWYNTERRKDFQSDSFMDSLLEGIQGCSAVVCYNDEVAIRVVSRLQKWRWSALTTASTATWPRCA